MNMKANPGGNLDPQQVYGRDALIELLWDRLEMQSILVNAERRIGKTQVLRKMHLQPKAGWKPIFRDLEKLHSAQEFAELVYDDVQQFLGTKEKARNFVRRFFEENETDHVNLKARTWKKLLTSAIGDLMQAEQTDRLVFFWDEVPYMLESICKNEGPGMAAEVLDTIRSLRVEHPKFRVIFTGSIGLHHVLGKLSAAGIPTSAKNDMYPVTVTPLAPQDAESLASNLLQGEGIECVTVTDAAATIAEEVDYFPFYIHHVIAGLRIEQLSGTAENIKDFVARQLVDASDPWQLAHYRTRLSTYYPDGNDANDVACILDVLALTNDSAVSHSVEEILEEAFNRGSSITDRNNLLRLLRLMDADHYLSRDTKGGYRFRFPLIRRWWKLDRGL
ncbi:hypothetical protein [Novipirellula sp.]|uniref:hypothetical protein n=1 Tax=Novipirellula sp. TaxID=2795430 RepID=UPI003563DC1E